MTAKEKGQEKANEQDKGKGTAPAILYRGTFANGSASVKRGTWGLFLEVSKYIKDHWTNVQMSGVEIAVLEDAIKHYKIEDATPTPSTPQT